MPLSAVDLIESILQIEKDLRPTMEEIYTSDYLKDYVEVQSRELEKRSKSQNSITVSIHCYDKPLHGNYDKEARSVSLNSRSTSPDQESSKVNPKKQNSQQTSLKNQMSQLPIKTDNSAKPGLVSLRGLINKEAIQKTRMIESQVVNNSNFYNDPLADVGSNISFELDKNADSYYDSNPKHSSPSPPQVKKKDCLVYQSISHNPLQKPRSNILSTSLNKPLAGLKGKDASTNKSDLKKKALSPIKSVKKTENRSKSPVNLSLTPNNPSNKSTKTLSKILVRDKSTNNKLVADTYSNNLQTTKQSGKTVKSKIDSNLSNKNTNNKTYDVKRASPSPVNKLNNKTTNDMKSRLNPLRQTTSFQLDTKDRLR